MASDTTKNSLDDVVSLLRDANAASELTLDEVSSHHYTLASSDSQNFIKEVPSLLSNIGDFLKSLVTLTKDVIDNGSFLVQNAKEERVSDNQTKKPQTDNASSGVTFDSLQSAASKQGWLGSLLSIGSVLIGVIVGSISQTASMIKLALSDTVIGKLASKVFQSTQSRFLELKTGVTNILDYVNGKFMSLVETIKQSKFAKMFSGLGESMNMLKQGLQFIFKGTGDDIVKTISRFVDPIITFFKFGKTLGSVLVKFVSKIAVPLTAIIALFDTVVGAIEGYKKEGISGAIKGGVGGLLNSLVGGLLDLVKDGVSWLLGALGWESAESALDSFSFSKLISDGVNAIVDMYVYFFDYIKEKFSMTKLKDAFEKYNIAGIFGVISGGVLDTIKGAISWALAIVGATDWAVALDQFSFQDIYSKIFKRLSDAFDYIGNLVESGYAKFKTMIGDGLNIADYMLKSILQNVLPRPNPNGNWYDPVNLASMSIPDTIYEFAGINKKTGEVKPIAAPQITPMPSNLSSVISSSPASSGGTTIINNVHRGGDVSNVSNSNVNNTNSATSPILTGSAMGILYAF